MQLQDKCLYTITNAWTWMTLNSLKLSLNVFMTLKCSIPCAIPSAAYTPTLMFKFSWVWLAEASLVHWLSQMFAPMAAALWQPYRKQMNTDSRTPTAFAYSRYTFDFTCGEGQRWVEVGSQPQWRPWVVTYVNHGGVTQISLHLWEQPRWGSTLPGGPF